MGRHRMTDPDQTDTAPTELAAEESSPEEFSPESTQQSARPALEIRGLRKTFGTGLLRRGPRVHALAGLDLTVPAGTVHALLGPNGAGKTTTVRAVATLLTPDEGTVLVLSLIHISEPTRPY